MDQSLTLWQALVGVGIIELLNWLMTFRSSIRKANTAADSDQFHLMKEAMEFLQGQLSEAISRNSELTNLRRSDQEDLRKMERRIADLEIDRVKVRCDILDCEFRDPPNIHTPPCLDRSRAELFRRRRVQRPSAISPAVVSAVDDSISSENIADAGTTPTIGSQALPVSGDSPDSAQLIS